jgi:hypothetical protein
VRVRERPPLPKPVSRIAPALCAGLLACAASGTGCERGCLATWLADHGAGGSAPDGSAAQDRRRAGLDLSGTDCPVGLARCVAGRVEVSRGGFIPYPCAPPPGASGPEKRAACECGWDQAGSCATGCAADGFEVVADAETARAQLCRPELPVARPFGPADPPLPGVCADEGIACVDGVVRLCEGAGKPLRPLALCAQGCAVTVGVPEGSVSATHTDTGGAGPARTGDGVAEILCRRAHAERR